MSPTPTHLSWALKAEAAAFAAGALPPVPNPAAIIDGEYLLAAAGFLAAGDCFFGGIPLRRRGGGGDEAAAGLLLAGRRGRHLRRCGSSSEIGCMAVQERRRSSLQFLRSSATEATTIEHCFADSSLLSSIRATRKALPAESAERAVAQEQLDMLGVAAEDRDVARAARAREQTVGVRTRRALNDGLSTAQVTIVAEADGDSSRRRDVSRAHGG